MPQAGDVQDGFRYTRVSELKNLRAAAYELEHEASGARILHVHAEDAENLFAVAFKTPPADNTGLPHILEHTVLCGSRRFPVKDPFIEMLKMSMATFLNAMTYADKTVYPVASNVRRDFYNLAEVYWDAVFHPRLEEAFFKQEGHHLEFDPKGDPAGPLIVKGIVFNEMKGAYSSSEAFVERESHQRLFPDTPYGLDSGGDPERIPELTYADFKRFHETWYHPSNARIFLYGDLPTPEHLAFLRPRLEPFRRREIEAPILRQPRWAAPREAELAYPIGPDEEPAEKAFVTLNWIVGDATDPGDAVAWQVLDRILLGNQAAPLRKALIDAKLGQDLTPSGVALGELETTFTVGMKGAEPGAKDRIAAVVAETLERLARDGIEPGRVEAAFQQVAYACLEIASLYPLWLMDRAYAAWPYGADPLAFLRADELLDAARRRYRADPGLFARMLRERLLENPHRLTLTFHPDPELLEKKERAFAAKMEARKAALSEVERRAVVDDARALEKLQNTPNPPEALATLPQLKVGDLPRKPRHIPTAVETLAGGAPFLRNDVFANGVCYLQLEFDLEGLPDAAFDLLPLYGDALVKMGAAGMDYVRMAERVAAHTGGIGFAAGADGLVQGPGAVRRSAAFSLKALDGALEPALAVLRDLLFEPDFADRERLRDVVVQAHAAHRGALVEDGVGLALRHAGRGLGERGRLLERMGGLPQVRLVERWARDFDAHFEALRDGLAALTRQFLNRRAFAASFTGSGPAAQAARKALDGWAAAMRDEPLAPGARDPFVQAAPPREGLAAPMEVAFCAQVLPAPHLSHPDTPALTVASRILSLGYMWDEVRLKGGAYDAGALYGPLDGNFCCYSYRDPWIRKTLARFKGLKEFVARANWSQLEIDRAIIGAAKHGEKPIRPGEATAAALWRHTHGDTPARREARHAALLDVTPADAKRAAAELLERQDELAAVCVVSSRAMLEQANAEPGDGQLAVEDILTT